MQRTLIKEDQRKRERRTGIRRAGERQELDAHRKRVDKLQSLLELGQVIGLELRLKEVLVKIAEKATKVMNADRCTFFLYDAEKHELWSTVALGMGEETIRVKHGAGIAGACFLSGEVINLINAYEDPRFEKELDQRTGYATRSLLCIPLHARDGARLGVAQLLNKKEGVFSSEDETFFRTFGNHASVFIEMAQLHQARILALEQSHAELERLNRAKGKALDHLSHELRTPVAVIQGNLKLLKRNLRAQADNGGSARFFETMERHLDRINEIQRETEEMMRSYDETKLEPVQVFGVIKKVIEKARRRASHRNLQFVVDGAEDLILTADRSIIEEALQALLKNAIENTPDEGLVRVEVARRNSYVVLTVRDFGVGITAANQPFIFDGLFHTQDTDLYASKRPYDFLAGGKGLDLHRIKLHSEHGGFGLALESHRCVFIPSDRDICPGRISACPHCSAPEDCHASGSTAFTLTFPAAE
jgi:signal transduction histidine kinase